ncbi:MAG: hypothetical protein M1830_000571 [Pleopsidium flavum]|nr:MAG: hypothetical protein M1830_004205 [Pleopsidium flavum]KAI9878562.1 MAG: hypothetical protein M1830_000571 [Pleopsidium flavum]
MPSPVQRVFGVCELLENILLNLSMPDLLLVQRVCTVWKDTIAQSISLQRKLFLSPVAPGPVSSKKNGLTLYDLKFNPLLRKIFHWKFVPYSSCSKVLLSDWGLDSPFGRIQMSASARYCPSASWRNMLITQPPPEALILSGYKTTKTLKVTKIVGGVTVGDLAQGRSWVLGLIPKGIIQIR